MAKGDKLAALDKLGIDAVCEALCGGELMTELAKRVGVSFGTLSDWLAADTERSARAREARRASARLWDEKAEEAIKLASDPFELQKAKELAHHYRWRGAKIAPADYGEKVAIGGAADLPPVQQETALDVSALPTDVLSAIMAARDAAKRD